MIGEKACVKFDRLVHERSDRALSQKEELFINQHRAICTACAQEEELSFMAFDMLREAVLEADVDSGHFDLRVVRLAKVQQAKESVRYWSPALIGGAVACLAVFASLKLASFDGSVKKTHPPVGQARRVITSFPDLELPNVIHRNP